MASRSEDDGERYPIKSTPGGEDPTVTVDRRRRDSEESNELTIHVKIGYKTLLLMLVTLDILHLSVREIVNHEIIQNFLSGLGMIQSPV